MEPTVQYGAHMDADDASMKMDGCHKSVALIRKYKRVPEVPQFGTKCGTLCGALYSSL